MTSALSASRMLSERVEPDTCTHAQCGRHNWVDLLAYSGIAMSTRRRRRRAYT